MILLSLLLLVLRGESWGLQISPEQLCSWRVAMCGGLWLLVEFEDFG
jgi:hypothetical protein